MYELALHSVLTSAIHQEVLTNDTAIFILYGFHIEGFSFGGGFLFLSFRGQHPMSLQKVMSFFPLLVYNVLVGVFDR